MKAVKTYLFSRTLTAAPRRGAELVREDAGPFVRELKKRPGRDILVMSGGNLASALFKAGVIDEVGLNIHPLLLGSGVPAFLDAGTRINLTLTECRTLDGGCVMVSYRVKR
jgi:riboflavin biosynthesis pyrimidine reductase